MSGRIAAERTRCGLLLETAHDVTSQTTWLTAGAVEVFGVCRWRENQLKMRADHVTNVDAVEVFAGGARTS